MISTINRGLGYSRWIHISLILFLSCDDSLETETETELEQEEIVISDSISDALGNNGADHEDVEDYVWDQSTVINVNLNVSSILVEPSAGVIDGTTFTITNAGTYNISGSLSDGSIVVDTEDLETVRLIFNGLDISSSTTAPVNIINSEKTIIVLVDNTVNKITDAISYVYASSDVDEPNAAIFSKSDLTIYGEGELEVKGNFEDGISSKDGLIIRAGTISVSSADDGIRGKDYAIVRTGNINVTAGGDGLKSDHEEDAGLGYVSVESGTLKIVSAGDAVSAETDLLIADGEFNLTSGGGSGQTVTENSAKGLKASVNVIIDKGNFVISSADDAIHSNNSVAINDGTFSISSGDDGIHADETLGINGGDVTISKSYEGIESSVISISDGTIHILSSDDGLNVAGGNDGSGWGGPTGGFSSSGDYYLYVNGGYIYISAKGDGVDVNGSIVMNDGVILVNGPTANNNGALDYDMSFKISGGLVLAAGSSGMAQIPDNTSTQNSVLINFSSSYTAGTLIHLESNDGEEIFTFKPAKPFQSFAFSSAQILTGSTYNLYLGGSSTGNVVDGLFERGEYASGTLQNTFTVSSINTKISAR